ncbi:MAG: hypothetical protein QM753_04330 [Thermomicrobiales bacterium]
MSCRRWSMLASLFSALVLAFMTPFVLLATSARAAASSEETPPIAQMRAQAVQTGEVTVSMRTCDVVRTSDVVTFTTTPFTPDGAYNCVDGLPDGTFLDIDGVDPDMVTDTTATWYWMLYGERQLNLADTDTSLPFNLASSSMHLYATYQRAQYPGGWVEVNIYDCAVAPVGTSVIVGVSDPVPDGFSVCVPGDTSKRDYGLLIDGQVPEYVNADQVLAQLRGGNHEVTANGGARKDFEINDWTVVLNLYTKGTVTSEPPITGLPDTGAGSGAERSSPTGDRDMTTPLALLAASLALGFVSVRTVRARR